MKQITLILLWFALSLFVAKAQTMDTFFLHHPLSKYDTIIYKRVISFDKAASLYHVRDYYPTGKIKREGHYRSIDKNIHESLWCNYFSNTKEGAFTEWFEDGQIKSKTNYLGGLRHGVHEYWYANGKKESIQHYVKGQQHGEVKYWDSSGILERELTFKYGVNQNPIDVHYDYLEYLPPGYDRDSQKHYPLIIYLHGGSSRGTDLTKLYNSGIPDQIYRKREFSFIILSPQCPVHTRWSTDNWFENFYTEVIEKYRIDTNRIYLTGESLGGSGTWYLATKYPEIFTAIAPISGFTHHIDYIEKHFEHLSDLPIWAFHGKIDKVVQFEDTERLIKLLEKRNADLKFTSPADIGHWIHWSVYPGEELFNWFLQYEKTGRGPK